METIKNNFLDGAKDTYYKYVENNLDGKRKQDLPEVEKVTIESVEKQEFAYDDTKDSEAYFVKAEWTYTKELDEYQKNAELVFVHQDNKLVLVELK